MQDPCYRKPRILVLKGIEDWISSGDVRFSLSMIAQRFLYDKGIADLRTSSFETRVVIVSTWMKVPEDLIPYVSYLDVDFPSETEIEEIIRSFPQVSEPHNLRTRRIGNRIAIEAHVRLDGAMSLNEAHDIVSDIERKIRDHFGHGTIVTIHMEPVKTA